MSDIAAKQYDLKMRAIVARIDWTIGETTDEEEEAGEYMRSLDDARKREEYRRNPAKRLTDAEFDDQCRRYREVAFGTRKWEDRNAD